MENREVVTDLESDIFPLRVVDTLNDRNGGLELAPATEELSVERNVLW